MSPFFIGWGIAAGVLTLGAVWIGNVLGRGPSGSLIDQRGRYSLTQLQLVLWSILVLSLIAGLFIGRLVAGVNEALGFTIPAELLIVLGISIGSSAASTVIKTGKDASHPDRIAASNQQDRPRFAQIFFLEEGELADQVVDVSKFQNFWLTLILLVAYLTLVINQAATADGVGQFTLPGFDQTFLTLLGISHAGYLAGKLPSQTGIPPGLTLAGRRSGAVPAAAAATTPPATFVPRNP